MTGQVHWLPFAFLAFAAVLVLYLWLRGLRDDRRYVVEKGTVRCRQRNNELVHITFVRDRATGQAVGIRACSKEPGVVRCNRACLPLLAQQLKHAPA
jgi:hypothetical protein